MFYLIESSDSRNDALFNLIKKDNFALRFLPGADLDAVLNKCADSQAQPADCTVILNGGRAAEAAREDDGAAQYFADSIFGRAAIVFSPTKSLTSADGLKLPKNSIVFGGKQSSEVLEILSARQIKYINLLKNEIFGIKNAVLTAEGALAHIIAASKKALSKTEILVLGCGRIGKAISILLSRLGIDAAIATFSSAEYESSALYTENCFLEYDFLDFLPSFDVIVNTIPKEILSAQHLQLIASTATVLDLASVPCLNKDELLGMEFKYISLLNLPAKFAPASAAEVMLECIYQEIANL